MIKLINFKEQSIAAQAKSQLAIGLAAARRIILIILLFFPSVLLAQEKQDEKEKKEKWYTDKFQLLYGKHVYPNQGFRFKLKMGGGAKNILLNQVLTVGFTPFEFKGFRPFIAFTGEHHSFTGGCLSCVGFDGTSSYGRVFQHSIFLYTAGLGIIKEFKFIIFKKEFQINVGFGIERFIYDNANIYSNGKLFYRSQFSNSTNAFYNEYFYKDMLEIRIVKTKDYKLFWTFNGIKYKNDRTYYQPFEADLTSLIIGLKLII